MSALLLLLLLTTTTRRSGGEYGNPALGVALLRFGDREADAGLVVHVWVGGGVGCIFWAMRGGGGGGGLGEGCWLCGFVVRAIN